jgi:hypothetical protein
MREFRVRLFPKEREITTDGGTGTDGLGLFPVLICVGVLALIVGYYVGVFGVLVLGGIAAVFFAKHGRKTEEQSVKNVSLRKGDVLDLRVGRHTDYDYNCVDVFYKGELVGEIKKSGIDEMIEKGALAKAKFSGYINDVPQITLTSLEHHEYKDKPKYKAWREKLKSEP